MKNIPLPRLDTDEELRSRLLKYCRLQPGDIWRDPTGKHSVGCLDAASDSAVSLLMAKELAALAIQDPPYNFVAFDQRAISEYIEWCSHWVRVTDNFLAPDSSLYVWLGADQKCGYQPLPDFMLMMRQMPFQSRSLITMRNQRGYGTQYNWMAVRQELLYYTKGKPQFNVAAEYTNIPKILRGYYKKVGEVITENLERSNSEYIRAGNVWVDIQQVFYRMEENVNGCYAQKPLKSAERIIAANSHLGDVVLDLFCHSGTTLIASELQGRRCITGDIDPLFCEITIRRLERFRKFGKTGWQNGNPFEHELAKDEALRKLFQVPSEAPPQQSLF
jgi:DNA modification methylase